MIRFAKVTDVDAIMEFIDEYWKKGHILGNNKTLFLYQHNMLKEELSFVIDENEDKVIDGVLGYIPYGKENRDVMLALWKVKHTGDPMLGVRMLQYLMDNVNARNISCPGINRKVRGIYEYLGYFTGEMKHWYRLNGKELYNIANIKEVYIPQVDVCKKYNLVKLETFDELEERFALDGRTKESNIPFKEKWYIKTRYFEHPMYKYEVYGVEYEKKTSLLVVTRIVECNGSKIIRVIDCIGNYEQLTYITAAFDDLLKKYDAEYIDCYVAGLPDSIFINSGWLDVKETEDIIPEYFSPYECKNIKIYYCSTEKNMILFKGDGDQDRPN